MATASCLGAKAQNTAYSSAKDGMGILWKTALCVAILPVAAAVSRQEPSSDAPAPAVDATKDPRTLVLETMREFRPMAPREVLRAIDNLLNVGEVDLAKTYFAEFLKGLPGEPELARLHEQFGSTFFQRLALDQRVAPDGARLARLVLEAATRAARDPRQLTQWVQDLAGDNYDARRIALSKLQNAGADGTVAVLQAMVDPAKQPPNPRLSEALLTLGKGTPEPLWGALRCEDGPLRYHALAALARQPLEDARPLFRWALGPGSDTATRELALAGIQAAHRGLPGIDEAQALLRKEVEGYLSGAKQLGSVDTLRWTIWYWTPTSHAAEGKEFPRRTAEWIVASRLAEDLLVLDPLDETHHELYWTAVLAATQAAYGYARPLAESAPAVMTSACQCPGPRLESVLRRGLEGDLTPAAIAACEALRSASSPPAMGKESAVAAALRHPLPRVRFAATALVMHWWPDEPFAAATDVGREIARLARGSAPKGVLILDPVPGRGEALAALCRQMGLAPRRVTHGREAFRLLVGSGGIDMILMHEQQHTPGWSEVWQQLQLTPVASGIPTALLYSWDEPRESAVDRIAIEEMGSALIRYPVPVNVGSLGALVRRLLSQVEAPLEPRERLAMAAEARTWGARILADPRARRIYPLGELQEALAVVPPEERGVWREE